MKEEREVKDLVGVVFYIKLVGVAAPPSQELDFVVRISCCCHFGSCSPAETVASVCLRFETCKCESLADALDEEVIG